MKEATRLKLTRVMAKSSGLQIKRLGGRPYTYSEETNSTSFLVTGETYNKIATIAEEKSAIKKVTKSAVVLGILAVTLNVEIDNLNTPTYRPIHRLLRGKDEAIELLSSFDLRSFASPYPLLSKDGKTVSVKMPISLKLAIEQRSRSLKVDRSTLIRAILSAWLRGCPK